ncbi:hypothetical protein [Alloscardovia macacae]|nr:hypothetical protein [Alloscardovia macacae]
MIPQNAFAADTVTYNGRVIPAHLGLTITHGEKEDGFTIDLSKYEIHGDTISIDPETLEVTSYYTDFSARTSASRGCTDSNAACWTSGTALGDMQFSGTGLLKGNWPNRDSFSTGDKWANITFMYHGKLKSVNAMPPHSRAVNIFGEGSDGKSVHRYA